MSSGLQKIEEKIDNIASNVSYMKGKMDTLEDWQKEQVKFSNWLRKTIPELITKKECHNLRKEKKYNWQWIVMAVFAFVSCIAAYLTIWWPK